MNYCQRFAAACVASGFLLTACGGDSVDEPPPQIASSFAISSDGWQGGYSDYHADTAPTDVAWEVRPLPAPLAGKAYYTGGTNLSDDLFIYNKKKFGGYAPNKQYKLTFEIELATNQSSGCVGVGGAPGESVYVVAGASSVEPKTVAVNGEYLLNLDRGNQGVAGVASSVLGNVANAVPDCGPQVFQNKVLKSSVPLTTVSNASGEIWIFFGIDSGFEAKSYVFYKSIKVAVTQAN